MYMLLTKFGQNPIMNMEGVANCQKEREKERKKERNYVMPSKLEVNAVKD